MIRAWNASMVLPGAAAAMLVFAGCSKPPGSGDEPQPAAGSATYGEPAIAPSNRFDRLNPHDPARRDWAQADFAIVQTELSPATLVHGRAKTLHLFAGLPACGLGAPSYLAFSTRQGPRSFRNGQALDPSGMEENWVLVWFAGSAGWTQWDSPWAIFLQHHPVAMALDPDGVHLEFGETAGDVVVMPLYGYEKPPAASANAPPRARSGPPRVETWKWAEALRRDPLLRVRYWAGVTRAFPLACEDAFQLDRAHDRVTVRQRFQYHPIADDWGTRPLRVAPVSPALALVAEDKTVPVRFSGAIRNYDYVTPFGPYCGMESAEGYDVTFTGLLRYVHELERLEPPGAGAADAARTAWEEVRAAGRERFGRSVPEPWSGEGRTPFCEAVQGLGWYARALPWFDPAVRTNALAILRQFVRDELLVTNRFEVRGGSSSRPFYQLRCPAAVSDQAAESQAPFALSLPEILWTYAHASGDWASVRERWDLVRAAFPVPTGVRWASFGNASHAPREAHAAACLAMARLAYGVGDLDQYQYACSLFVRELVVVRAQLNALDYSRQHQPWHSPEPIPVRIGRMDFTEGTPGWSVAQAGADSAPERLSWLCAWRAPDERPASASPARADAPGAMGMAAVPGSVAPLAQAMERLRRRTGSQVGRLIPPGPATPSPWIVGVERDVRGANPGLVDAVAAENGTVHLTWPAWRTPTGREWCFGQVRSGGGETAPVRVLDLNWNTRVWMTERRP